MRQDRRLRQQVVVCKTAAGESCGAEVLRLPRLAPELGCCLQDRLRRGRRAKPLQRNALGPKLSCCLQDCTVGASGRGTAVARGFAQRRRDSSADTASSNRDCGSAIFAGCRGRRRGIRDRRRVCCGDNRSGGGAGIRFRCKRPGGAGTLKAGTPAGSRGNPFTHMNGVVSSRRTSSSARPEFRNCCRVATASPPMASLADYNTGEIAVV